METILRLDYPRLTVVIWDNGSTDGTVDYLRRRLIGVERARLIASPDNCGVVAPMYSHARARNLQARPAWHGPG